MPHSLHSADCRQRTSTGPFLQEVLDDLCFYIVAWLVSNHSTKLPEFPQQTVFVLWVTLLSGQAGLVGRGDSCFLGAAWLSWTKRWREGQFKLPPISMACGFPLPSPLIYLCFHSLLSLGLG